MTDGAVANEAELLTYIHQALANRRLFTVGIGSAPNAHFMHEAARVGRGSHTYANIQRTGEFVINVPSVLHAAALEICGRSIPPDRSELDEAGLTAAAPARISVPIIAECVANIECEFWKELVIGYHSFVVGKAVAGHIAESAQDTDGGLDVVGARVCYDIRYPHPDYAVMGEVTTVGA